MKRAKRLYALLGVLAAVCVVTLAVISHEEKKEEIRTSGEVVLEVDPDAVQSLSWDCGEQSLSFHKDEVWLYDEDEAFPADEEKISELLELFRQFSAAFIIEDVTDFSQYGLDEPACTIRLDTDSQQYEITLGDFSSMDSQRYVCLGGDTVYLVSDDPMDSFDVALSELIDNDETPGFDQVESILFEGEDSYQVVYEAYTEDSAYTYCSEDVYFRQEGDDLLPLDTGRVESYLSTITSLTLTDYVTYTASQEDLSAYGLDDPELTLTVQYTPEAEDGEEEPEETVFTLSISRDPEERAAAEADEETQAEDEDAEEEEITAYVRVGQSEIIYQIDGSSYEALMAAGYDDLRHEEVLTADFDDVTGLDISLEGQVYTITSQGDGEDRVLLYNDEEFEADDLQSALEDLLALSFTDEQPTQKEEIGLTVYLDNEAHPKVQIELYRYDGEQCLAVVDGQPVSLVSRSAVVDLIEAINAIVL